MKASRTRKGYVTQTYFCGKTFEDYYCEECAIEEGLPDKVNLDNSGVWEITPTDEVCDICGELIRTKRYPWEETEKNVAKHKETMKGVEVDKSCPFCGTDCGSECPHSRMILDKARRSG